MDLYKEILIGVLENRAVEVAFPGLTIEAKDIVGMRCYQALQQIQLILQDDRLADKDCFQKIEAIVSALNKQNISTGSRHDFG
ncbi:MAG: hypothetical protein FWF49_00510 [Oscillospiraceae bacterium]|nr:hypothetical protein [Oscillospiraceae bacterium]